MLKKLFLIIFLKNSVFASDKDSNEIKDLIEIKDLKSGDIRFN